MIKMTAGIYLTIMITTIVVIGVAACAKRNDGTSQKCNHSGYPVFA